MIIIIIIVGYTSKCARKSDLTSSLGGLALVLDAHSVGCHFNADDSQVYFEMDLGSIVGVSGRVLSLVSFKGRISSP